MRRLLATLTLVLLPLLAAADGKVYVTTAVASPVNIPDQRALIHFTNGVERLVIETRFTSAGTHFAWVLPLPRQPVIEEATPGLFPTLQYLFQPRVEHAVPRYFIGVCCCLGLVYLLLFVRPQRPVHWLDLAACLLVAGSLGLVDPALGTLTGVALAASIAAVRVFKTTALTILFLILIYFVLLAMMFPALGRAQAGAIASSHPAVSILERKIVGAFEITTLASEDASALGRWLRDQGFGVSTNSERVIADYVRQQWVFVAAKLNRGSNHAASETTTIHPLSFTFPTARPLYPMRLTGVDNGPVSVELFVFGPDRAQARGFEVKDCVQPDYPPPPSDWTSRKSERIAIVHPLLRKWVEGAPVATRLTSTLAPEAMREDVVINWVPFSKQRARLYSPAGARVRAFNWASGVFAAGLLAACGVSYRRKALICRFPSLTWALAALVLFTGAFIYLASPKVEVRLVKAPAVRARLSVESVGRSLTDGAHPDPAVLSAEARELLRNMHGMAGMGSENVLLGGEIREEDSPGNYTIRRGGGGVEFVTYDLWGAEHVLRTIPLRPESSLTTEDRE
ncbi:MAG TPA: DUF2330 domain-containing protein [Candidatus Paceibacterota bacterium]|nr:DUF2330 domain-containing protein [Candidatus Paceibacterota bacterium]HRT56167.1 DUF2330 domain-containing protein [Candidatus Paceibacterota bacterium]